MTMGTSMLQELYTLLYEHPFFLISLDIVIKSILIISLTLIVSKVLVKNAARSSNHLLWVSCLFCVALIPLIAITPGINGKETFVGNSIFVFAVQPKIVSAATAAPSTTLPFGVIFFLLYLGPCILLLYRLLVSTIAVSGISNRATVVRNKLEFERLRMIESKIGLSRSVVLKQSKEITSPFSFGLISPKIILPASLDVWSESMFEDVLVHEMSHIKRFDWITMLSCHVITSIYWFNPLCWIALRKVNEEAENCCDAAVMEYGQSNTGYAENLLLIAKRSRDSHRLLVQMIADKRFLPKRIEQILESNMDSKISRKFVLFLTVSVFGLLVIFGNTQIVTTHAQQSSSELFPISAVIPEYPTRASSRGIEGWTQVQFTVDSNGNVIEDSIIVLDEEPPGVFNRTSVRAAAQFEFSPRVVNGVAVDVANVQYVFRYALDVSDELIRQGLTRFIYHEVARGDTLSDIANQYQVSISILMQVNSIDERITIGQILRIPSN